MIASSEQRRAGIAVIGVTVVLAIAAGIHFVAPGRSDDPISRAPLTSIARAVPTELAPTLGPQSIEPTVVRHTRPSVRRRSPAFEPPIVDASAAGADSAAHVAAPVRLGAGRALPESMVFVAPSETFPETRWAETASSSEPGIVPHPSQRGAVTSAFATAGTAVAGGFRTAGRALKRAF
jgi:hypothetical protein